MQNSTMEIWTHQIDHETLNIVHIHVNDTSDEVTLDLAYMHSNEQIENHQEFKTDISGKPLKYKIVVKEAKVFKIYYNQVSNDGSKNILEVPFVENSIKYDQKYLNNG